MKPPEQKPKLNIKKAIPHPLDKADNIFQELREAHWKNKEMIDREMLTKYPEVLDKRLEKYDGYLKDLVKINYPADEIDQVKQGLIDIKKLRQDYDQVWGSDKQDMDEAKKIKTRINTKLAEAKVLEQMLNFEKSKEDWLGFYKKYSINASSLTNIKLTKEGMKTQREMAEKYGFDKIVMIPAGVSPELLIANESFAIFNDTDAEAKQNTGPQGTINDWSYRIIGSEDWKQKTDKPQVIFLKNKPDVDMKDDETMKKVKKIYPDLLKNVRGDIREGTRDQGFVNIKKMEKELDLQGLDMVTAMILDRQNFENTGHHLWDWDDNNGVWLTKTEGKIEAGRCVSLRWPPSGGRLNLNLGDGTSCYDSLGSVFTCSLEIKEI